MRLARKLVLVLCLAMLVVFAARGYLRAREQVQLDESRLGDEQRTIGHALRPAVKKVWLAEGRDRAFALLASADSGLHRLDVEWVDQAPSAAVLAAADEHGKDWTQVEAAEGASMLRTYVPVRIDPQTRGWLRLSEPILPYGQRLGAEARAAAVTAGLSAAFAILVSSVVGFLMIGRPVRHLVDRAKRIGCGDLSASPLTRAPDEIGELAREMESMCHGLRAARERADAESAARLRILEQLRHADRLATIGQLASGVAHELGTPLTTIMGRAKLIATGRAPGDEATRSAEVIGEQSARMARIIRQLLDLARKGEVDKSIHDLHALLVQTRSLLGSYATKQDVKLELLPSDAPVSARADAGQIEQVLSNLIINAVQASAPGSTIELSARVENVSEAGVGCAPGRYARMTVSDHGAGILPDQALHIFEPFFTTKPVGEGTGLGLSIAHGIVRDHGGWIAVESQPDRGSRFSVYIPFASEERPPAPREEAFDEQRIQHV